jgi:lysophospholipase L1-like esterase
VRVFLLLASSVAAYFIEQNNPKPIRVACVGDSLTQSTKYTHNLVNKLGVNYTVGNFGVDGTTVTLNSYSPYMETMAFQEVLDFKPEIIIIMLGTNDANCYLSQYNTVFVDDYITLIHAFQKLPNKPEIWLVLPPPIFRNSVGYVSEYFEQTVIPGIKQAAKKTNLQVIDVYSLLLDYSEHFPDGIHPKSTTDNCGNEPVTQIIVNTIYNTILLHSNS